MTRHFPLLRGALAAAALLALVGAALANPPPPGPRPGVAPAHHPTRPHARVGVGVYVGPGFGWPAYAWPRYYGYYPGYYYPGVYPGFVYPGYAPGYVYGVPAESAAPPQYIEQGSDGQAVPVPSPGQPAWWHYCNRPEGYYPYVRTCPGGWQVVPAQPPAAQ